MPTGFTPIYQIQKDGVDITDHFNDRTTMIQVVLSSGNGSPDTFQISLDDRDFAIASPTLGSKLAIYLGYAEVGMAFMGTFEINEITYKGMPKSILLTGLAAGMSNAMKSQANVSFEKTTLGKVLGDLAGKAGLSASVSSDLSSKEIPFLNQSGVSPYHMIQQLEKQYDAVAKFKDGKLSFSKRDEGADDEGNLNPMLVLKPEHFGEWAVKHTQRPDYSAVKAAWWDPDKLKTNWVSAGKPGGGEEDADTPFRMNKRFKSQEEAQTAANSRMASLTRSEGEADVTLAKGDPWITDQMKMFIGGMRDGVNGSYITDTVTHSYTKEDGVKTHILAKPPGGGDDYTDQLDDAKTFSPIDGSVIDKKLAGNTDSDNDTPATATPTKPAVPDGTEDT